MLNQVEFFLAVNSMDSRVIFVSSCFDSVPIPFQTVVIFPRRTALHIAVRDGSVEFVRLLLDNHANVNIGDENDVTPLHTASCLGLMDIARILLQTGTRQHQHYS